MSRPTQKMLGACLRAWRTTEHVTLRKAAEQIGISHSTLSRIELGETADGHSIWKILIWLNTPSNEGAEPPLPADPEGRDEQP
jgi:transcriptional regulator with XRE-family HTH domain